MNPTRFLDGLHSLADAPAALVSLAIVAGSLIVFGRFVSPWLKGRTGGQPVLDITPWRSPEDVDAALEAYGASGRQWYRRYLLADALFPVLYSPLLAVSVAFGAQQLRLPSRYVEAAIIIPFIGGAFDWCENALLWVQTSRVPDQGERLSRVAGVMTVLKFAMLGTSVFVSFTGLVCVAFRASRDAL